MNVNFVNRENSKDSFYVSLRSLYVSPRKLPKSEKITFTPQPITFQPPALYPTFFECSPKPFYHYNVRTKLDVASSAPQIQFSSPRLTEESLVSSTMREAGSDSSFDEDVADAELIYENTQFTGEITPFIPPRFQVEVIAPRVLNSELYLTFHGEEHLIKPSQIFQFQAAEFGLLAVKRGITMLDRQYLVDCECTIVEQLNHQPVQIKVTGGQFVQQIQFDDTEVIIPIQFLSQLKFKFRCTMEVIDLISNEIITVELANLPSDKKIAPNEYLFRHKYNNNSKILICFKADRVESLAEFCKMAAGAQMIPNDYGLPHYNSFMFALLDLKKLVNGVQTIQIKGGLTDGEQCAVLPIQLITQIRKRNQQQTIVEKCDIESLIDRVVTNSQSFVDESLIAKLNQISKQIVINEDKISQLNSYIVLLLDRQVEGDFMLANSLQCIINQITFNRPETCQVTNSFLDAIMSQAISSKKPLLEQDRQYINATHVDEILYMLNNDIFTNFVQLFLFQHSVKQPPVESMQWIINIYESMISISKNHSYIQILQKYVRYLKNQDYLGDLQQLLLYYVKNYGVDTFLNIIIQNKELIPDILVVLSKYVHKIEENAIQQICQYAAQTMVIPQIDSILMLKLNTLLFLLQQDKMIELRKRLQSDLYIYVLKTKHIQILNQFLLQMKPLNNNLEEKIVSLLLKKHVSDELLYFIAKCDWKIMNSLPSKFLVWVEHNIAYSTAESVKLVQTILSKLGPKHLIYLTLNLTSDKQTISSAILTNMSFNKKSKQEIIFEIQQMNTQQLKKLQSRCRSNEQLHTIISTFMQLKQLKLDYEHLTLPMYIKIEQLLLQCLEIFRNIHNPLIHIILDVIILCLYKLKIKPLIIHYLQIKFRVLESTPDIFLHLKLIAMQRQDLYNNGEVFANVQIGSNSLRELLLHYPSRYKIGLFWCFADFSAVRDEYIEYFDQIADKDPQVRRRAEIHQVETFLQQTVAGADGLIQIRSGAEICQTFDPKSFLAQISLRQLSGELNIDYLFPSDEPIGDHQIERCRSYIARLRELPFLDCSPRLVQSLINHLLARLEAETLEESTTVSQMCAALSPTFVVTSWPFFMKGGGRYLVDEGGMLALYRTGARNEEEFAAELGKNAKIVDLETQPNNGIMFKEMRVVERQCW